ncbi:MAG: acyl-CoA dehydrogenase [Hydrocarboniphaga sp.]|uniref:acyl-CoA dehydrogenase family protein n=1 Tax=Hydrocarboniphaga sp. TaxID=2033016 RepID=UPI00260F6EF5|nr:acyl-CoA dehydrogenase family protein [Hydrocarboniphaga sp.]MDB5969963.1 acyl-CoA dehydrogenase [Hydrocarboniphaga sp.]
MQRDCFTQEQELFRDSYRQFLQKEVLPHRDEWRKAGIVPREMFRKMGDQGYLMIWADEQYGGLGIDDFRYQQVMMEEDSQYGDIGFYHTLHSRLVGPYLKHFGSDEQRARFLPRCISGDCILAVAMTEPDAGSDLAGIKSRAVDHGDHWILNGAKTYISNGINADLVVVAAKTSPDNPRQIGLFLVERGMEGFERGRNLAKMGMKSQDTAELFFRDVKIPKENVLGDASKGFHYLMRGLAEERLIGAAGYLGNAWRSYEVTRDFVMQRKVFGKPLSDQQNTRFKMASLRVELEVAQTYVDHCVTQQNAGKLTPESAAIAKLYVSEVEGRVVDECVQLHGGAGYMEEYEVCWRYTDARISRIYAGSSEIMREIIARSIFGR